MHLVTQCFQAIRIFINDELAQIEAVLPKAFAALAPAGRLAVISFHSLEDRLVKQYFRAQTRSPEVPRRLPIAADRLPQAPARLIGKAQRAGADELEANPRARSATLRVLERCS
jgi:16S rRNA (cytosine1402-N4)-methyltransferase